NVRITGTVRGHDCRVVGDGRFAALVASARRRARDAYAAVRRTRQSGDDHDGGDGGRRGWRIAGLILAIITVTALGTGLALRLGGHVSQDIGPVSPTFALQPPTDRRTGVPIPPPRPPPGAPHH